MSVTEFAIKHLVFSHWVEPIQAKKQTTKSFREKINLVNIVRQWINDLEINSPKLAHKICHLIPAQCPFARKIQFLGRTIVSIPPLCKINPVYDELMMLRFRALSYLADVCGEDISAYC
ncbi:Mo-dependent nitrogenase C-terminal domain-containing protein [Chroococcus sp. FPU101]|uniref:Mo-dependent nitrogenase C-terminal domain-containing protein n=1 Tax=Chroococcus sp. FPU101 TaxID=1974212 RepID=UPI001A8C5B03|nr:Mo-dependent nitrogenase C-terminal domain-containing protein [Chroococcus sp. FPU101]GFE70611.1 Mo-dependent nitrogenase-like [Chroococcus sp. FPU101]